MTTRILVIEDEAVLRSSLARGLRRVPGLAVAEAGSVSEALVELDRAAPDLVISDIDLPDRTGIEILGELGKRGQKVPVVFVSAYLSAFRAQIPRHADVEVREKPVSLDELRELIARRFGAGERTADGSPFSATDFLQLACMGKHSVAIELWLEGRVCGTVRVSGGEVWSAEDPAGRGMEALRRVLFAAEGHVTCRTLRDAPGERNVVGAWQELLLEAARLEDEAAAEEAAPGSAAPAAPGPPAPAAPPPAAEPAGPSFDDVWDEGVLALLRKDYEAAYRAFRKAAAIRPGDGKVEANLLRLRELGVVGPE